MHHCHATGCKAAVPPEMFACKRHWFALPKPLRDRIWKTYRPGQCDDWQISHEYAEAAREAVRFLAELDGVEPNVRVYDMLDPVKPAPVVDSPAPSVPEPVGFNGGGHEFAGGRCTRPHCFTREDAYAVNGVPCCSDPVEALALWLQVIGFAYRRKEAVYSEPAELPARKPTKPRKASPTLF